MLGGHHPHRLAYIHTKQQLNQAPVDMLQKEGCTCRTIRWHRRQSRGAQPSDELLQRKLMLRDHPICAQMYKVSQLPEIKPARTVMVATALFQLVVSISRLASAVAAVALFSRVLSVILDMELFCEADGYYDYIPTSTNSIPHKVTPQMAARGLGEAGRVRVAWSIWRKVVPKGLKTAYRKATRHYHPQHMAHYRRQDTIKQMLESVMVRTNGL